MPGGYKVVDECRVILVPLALPRSPTDGLSRISTQTDVEPPPHPLRVCMRIHPEGKSRGLVRSRFECMFSMTLLHELPPQEVPRTAEFIGRS